MSTRLDLKGLWLLFKFIIFMQFLKGLGKKPTQGMSFLFLQSLSSHLPHSVPMHTLLCPHSHCFGLICYCHVVYTPLFFIATPPFPVQSGRYVWSGKIHAHSAVVAVGEWGKDMTAFQNSSPLISHKFWFLTMFCPINQIMEKLKKSREMNKVASFFKEVCKNGDLGLQRQEMGVDRKMKRMRQMACSVVLCSR